MPTRRPAAARQYVTQQSLSTVGVTLVSLTKRSYLTFIARLLYRLATTIVFCLYLSRRFKAPPVAAHCKQHTSALQYITCFSSSVDINIPYRGASHVVHFLYSPYWLPSTGGYMTSYKLYSFGCLQGLLCIS